ncbi:MAG: CARDB domain-containing protein [Nitrososphaerota archaeon]
MQVNKPDLVPKDLTLSANEVVAGGKIRVSFKVLNQGQGGASASKTRVRLSKSSERPSPNDPLLAQFDTPALEVNQSVEHSEEVTIPVGTQPGDYYVWVIVDADSTVGQSDETNDRIKVALKVLSGNQPPQLVKIESPPDEGVATTRPWFRLKAADPDGDRLKYRIELKHYGSQLPPIISPPDFPEPTYVFDQAKDPKGWMPGNAWEQNVSYSTIDYASDDFAQFQPKEPLPEGYYLWRVIVTDSNGAAYETPRSQWRTFRIIKHNPIVLVHGFDFVEMVQGKSGKQPDNWNATVEVLKEFGYIPLYDSYNGETDEPEGPRHSYADLFVVDKLDTRLTVSANAGLMGDYMTKVVRPRLSYEVVVDLIGHSMGGLIARAYVGETYKIFKESAGQGSAVLLARVGSVGVERIVTLGTPNSGAPLADLWQVTTKEVRWAIGKLFGLSPEEIVILPALNDLSSKGACNLNTQYPVKDELQYFLFAGKISGPVQVAVNTFWLASFRYLGRTVLGIEQVLGPNDVIVPWWSAYWYYDCIPQKKRRLTPNVKEVFPEIDMGNDIWAHFNLIKRREIIREWVRRYRELVVSGGVSKLALQPTRQRNEIEIPEVSGLWQGLIKQGETAEYPVSLDVAGEATFALNWLAGQVSFTLQSPTGQQITPEQAEEGGDIQFFEMPTLLGTVKMFVIKSAAQGRWVMKVRGEADLPSDGTPALMWAAFYSPINLGVTTQKLISSVGESIVVKARLTKGN